MTRKSTKRYTRIRVRLSKAEHEALRKLAAARHVSVNRAWTEIIMSAMN